jgi:hypothetical protein
VRRGEEEQAYLVVESLEKEKGGGDVAGVVYGRAIVVDLGDLGGSAADELEEVLGFELVGVVAGGLVELGRGKQRRKREEEREKVKGRDGKKEIKEEHLSAKVDQMASIVFVHYICPPFSHIILTHPKMSRNKVKASGEGKDDSGWRRQGQETLTKGEAKEERGRTQEASDPRSRSSRRQQQRHRFESERRGQ